MRSFVALSALKPLGEELEGLGDLGLSDPIGSIGALAELRVRPRQARGAARPRHARARASSRRWPTRSATRSSACAAVARGCCASTARGSSTRACTTSATGRRAQRHLRADRRALARDRRSSRSRASRPRARSASSPRRSARRAGAARRQRARRARAQRRRAHALDRAAGLQARRLRLRAVRGLSHGSAARGRRSTATGRSSTGTPASAGELRAPARRRATPTRGWPATTRSSRAIQTERPDAKYRDVMASTLAELASEAGAALPEDERDALGRSLPGWPRIPRSRGPRRGAAGGRRRDHRAMPSGVVRGAVVHETALQVGHDWPLEQTASIAHANVHVAQSHFHDIVAAHELGIPSIWINRLGESAEPAPTREQPTLSGAGGHARRARALGPGPVGDSRRLLGHSR